MLGLLAGAADQEQLPVLAFAVYYALILLEYVLGMLRNYMENGNSLQM